MDAAVPITAQRPHDVFGHGRPARRHRVSSDATQLRQPPFAAAVGGPAGYAHPPAKVPPTGDHRQAEYFVRLLTLRLGRTERRIAKCRRAIACSEAAGDIENVIGFRDLLVIEQQERRTVEGLIANLQRRFDLPNSAQDR